MTTSWILVANACQAKLYSVQRARLFYANGSAGQELKLVKEFQHETSRLKNMELVSDKSGNYKGGQSGHGSFMETFDAKDMEADKFARTLAFELESGRNEHSFDDLIIVASPHFQGLIRSHLKENVTRMISKTLEKDYTQVMNRDLVMHLKDHL